MKNSHQKYISSLPKDQRDVLSAYTHNGDVVLNSYERTGEVSELLMEYISVNYNELKAIFPTVESLSEPGRYIEEYRSRLNAIIENAPPIKKIGMVYRGLKGDYFHFPNILFQNNGIMSTTIDRNVADGFGDTVLRIMVPVECSGLYVESITRHRGECEIIFPTTTRYVICDHTECMDDDSPLYRIVC